MSSHEEYEEYLLIFNLVTVYILKIIREGNCSYLFQFSENLYLDSSKRLNCLKLAMTQN